MRVHIEETKQHEPRLGDTLSIKFKHMHGKDFQGMIVRSPRNGSIYIHGFDGHTQFYATRGFSTPEELIRHMRLSSSIASFVRYSSEQYDLTLAARKITE